MTLLKFLFLYLPASFAYYTLIYTVLIMLGWVSNPNDFNPDDYEHVATTQTDDGTKVTYHVAK